MKIKINRWSFPLSCFLIVYLKPYNVTLFPTINVLFQFIKFVGTAILILLFILQNKKISRFTGYAVGFCITWCISMLKSAGSLGSNLQVVLSIIGISLLFDYFSNTLKFEKYIYKSLSLISKYYIFLNTISFFKGGTFLVAGGEEEFFLGKDNFAAFILVALCGIVFANDLLNYEKIRINTWIFAIIGFIGLCYRLSYAGMITYFILLIVVVYMNYPQIKKLLSVKNVILLSTAVLISIISFNIQRFIQPLMYSMGKTGFSAREFIWPRALYLIKSNWIWGYGYFTESQLANRILYGADHPHNFILEYLLFTGIIGTVVFLGWIIYTLKIPKEIRQCKHINVLILCFAAILLDGIFDFYMGLIYMYVIMALIHLSTIILMDKKLE